MGIILCCPKPSSALEEVWQHPWSLPSRCQQYLPLLLVVTTKTVSKISPKVLIQVQSRTPGLHTLAHFFLITTQSRRNCHSLAKEPEAQRGLVPDVGEASCGTHEDVELLSPGMDPSPPGRSQESRRPPSSLGPARSPLECLSLGSVSNSLTPPSW